MADVKLHPALRADLERQLHNWRRVLADDGILYAPLSNPAYREGTAARAAASGMSIEEMHKRGVDAAKAEAEAAIALIVQILTHH